jgi:hypothetical protein
MRFPRCVPFGAAALPGPLADEPITPFKAIRESGA